jgi:WD40 repeat protein
VAATTTPRPRTSPPPRTRAHSYDAFVSYSHAADGRLAPALQAGLQSLAKPWYRRRALRVFRDKTSLSASPELWSAIEAALDQARYFVLLASPKAAASHWVDQEVRWWRAHRAHDSVLIALTDGELGWDEGSGDFDASAAIPPGLRGWFPRVPLWVDLRWARAEQDVSMRNPRFRNSVGELAAPLHGVPKDELIGEDISQHRRTLRLARGAVALLVLLLALAIVGGIVALMQRSEAISQRDQALSRALAARASESLRADPELGILLAREAVEARATPEAEASLRQAIASSRAELALHDHDRPVVRAAFSPDAELVASAEKITAKGDSSIRIWEADTGTESAAIEHRGSRFGGPIAALGFSASGQRIVAIPAATGGPDWNVAGARAWNTSTGELVAAGRSAVNAFDLGPGAGDQDRLWTHDSALVSISALRISDPLTGRTSGWLRGDFGPVLGSAPVAQNPDGTLIALTIGSEALGKGGAGPGIWNARGGPRRAILAGYPVGTTADVEFSPDGALLAAGGADTTVRVWRSSGGRPISVLRVPGPVSELAFSGDGTQLLTAMDDGLVQVWDPRTGRLAASLIGHDDTINSAAFSPDGTRVLTASEDGTARIWKSAVPGGLALDGATRIKAAAFSPDGGRIVTGSDVATRLYDADSGELVAARAGGPLAPRFSLDENLLIGGGAGHEVRVWDIAHGDLVARLETPGGLYETQDAILVPDSELALVVDGNRHGALWDLRSGSLVRRIGELMNIEEAAVSSGGRRIVGIGRGRRGGPGQGSDPRGMIWDLEGEPLLPQPMELPPANASGLTAGATYGSPDVIGAEFSPDGSHVLTMHDEVTALWDADNGRKLREFPSENEYFTSSYSSTFSPDGDLVVTGAQSIPGVWEVATGRRIASLRNAGVLLGARFSPDGKFVLTASESTSRLWDAATGELLAGWPGGVASEAPFSPDGTQVLAGGGGTLHIYQCEVCGLLAELLDLAGQRVTRELTDEERATYGLE